MNQTFTNRKLVVAFSPDFKVQTAFDAPIAAASLTARHPQTSPAFHAIIPFREETRDCSGEFIIIEKLTGKIARFTFAFDVTAKLSAGWLAYLQGVAAAPTGSPANETQTISLNGATGGTATFGLDFEGLAGSSGSVATTAALTAAQLQAALESARAIKAGGVAVTGSAGGPFTVEFTGRLAKADVPLLTVVDTSTGGTGITIAAGVTGANNVQEITRSTSQRPVLFSLIEGFEGETNGAKRYKNLVAGEWTVTGTRRGKVTITVVAFGDPTPEILASYVMPACVDQDPIRTADCRVKIGADWITDDLRDFTVTESNNIDVSEDALRFDDITPDRLERGDRSGSISLTALGVPSSALYAFAADENNAFASFQLSLGNAGERLSLFAPRVQFKIDDGLVEFVGTRNRSAFKLTGRPSPDGSGVVTRGQYVGAFATRFLLT